MSLMRSQGNAYAYDFIWDEFNSSISPKTLILGNDFFFLQGEAENEIIVRRHGVNSYSEFEKFKSKQSDKEIKQVTPYPFSAISSVSPLPVIFEKADLRLCTLLNSSRVTLNDLLANDIVFLGAFRNLYLLERLLKDNYLTFNLVQNNISVTIAANDSTKTLKLLGTPDSEHSDFCFFRKLPGPRNNTIILFMSFFDTGMRATMNFISDPNEVKGLEQVFVRQFGHVPKYFDVLFKVSGYSRTAFKIGVEHLHEINPQKPQIWE